MTVVKGYLFYLIFILFSDTFLRIITIVVYCDQKVKSGFKTILQF